MTTEKRQEFIAKTIWRNDKIKNVPTFKVNSKEQAMEYYQRFMNEGYEGIMFRNEGASYLPQYRSKDLQKYKEFQDDEFEIVGGKEADGEDRGTIIFECKSERGTFWVRPRGSREYRKRLLADLANLTGKNLTVRYQNLTEYGEPRFPVGITVRDYE
jgi:DNA ligase-1